MTGIDFIIKGLEFCGHLNFGRIFIVNSESNFSEQLIDNFRLINDKISR